MTAARPLERDNQSPLHPSDSVHAMRACRHASTAHSLALMEAPLPRETSRLRNGKPAYSNPAKFSHSYATLTRHSEPET